MMTTAPARRLLAVWHLSVLMSEYDGLINRMTAVVVPVPTDNGLGAVPDWYDV